ncbi:alpha/beta fold hydrolase [Rhodoligotrophos defluvii]|uniref:alpha/beta fold hydrolase n=1 Tax=Rhodoligotrophos defluvii TaxID=2561934 RepID=UPI001EF050ED|nr:alpha/beta hydrolase [Rhodoligotrophos defluvii]
MDASGKNASGVDASGVDASGMNALPWRLVTYRSADGLKLVARDYGPEQASAPPVLCLAGLTRNAKDFHALALVLAESGRRVIVPDYRGRGRSDYGDWRLYTPQVELQDTIQLLTLLRIGVVDLVGTSRGGIIAMLAAAASPGLIRRCVLNDIGPVIEAQGLLRIKSYVGRQPAQDWSTAIADLARAHPEISGFGPADWAAFAERIYRDQGGYPVLDYDPALAHALPDESLLKAAVSGVVPLPTLWAPFKLLAARPVLVLRGEHSDLLSPLTLRRMTARRPTVQSLTIPGRGHAPFLDEPAALAAVSAFLS